MLQKESLRQMLTEQNFGLKIPTRTTSSGQGMPGPLRRQKLLRITLEVLSTQTLPLLVLRMYYSRLFRRRSQWSLSWSPVTVTPRAPFTSVSRQTEERNRQPIQIFRHRTYAQPPIRTPNANPYARQHRRGRPTKTTTPCTGVATPTLVKATRSMPAGETRRFNQSIVKEAINDRGNTWSLAGHQTPTHPPLLRHLHTLAAVKCSPQNVQNQHRRN